MYKIYRTQAIVIERSLKEHQVTLILFTELFGLVYCIAQGIGKLSSKNRQHLSTLDLVSVSLVRGAHTWRLVGAELIEACPKYLISVSARVTDTLRKIVPKEEIAGRLFRRLVFLYDKKLQVVDPHMVELWIMASVLAEMGYVDMQKIGVSHSTDEAIWPQEINELEKNKSTALVLVNKGLSYAVAGKRVS